METTKTQTAKEKAAMVAQARKAGHSHIDTDGGTLCVSCAALNTDGCYNWLAPKPAGYCYNCWK